MFIFQGLLLFIGSPCATGHSSIQAVLFYDDQMQSNVLSTLDTNIKLDPFEFSVKKSGYSSTVTFTIGRGEVYGSESDPAQTIELFPLIN